MYVLNMIKCWLDLVTNNCILKFELTFLLAIYVVYGVVG